MLVSVFSCIGVTASAAGVAQDLFTVEEGEFQNDKITYTVYLNKGVSMIGAIIYAKFDSQVVTIDEANTGAYMITDSYGDECQSINGVYEQGFMAETNDQYSIAHVFGTESDYKAGSDKAYMQFTFKAIDGNRPKTTVKFYCFEFESQSAPENNIANGSDSLIHSDTRTTLGQVIIDSVESEKDGVRVSWEKVTGADFYRVYKKIDGKYEIIKETADGNVTDYLDEDVKNNTSYTYAVRAVNEASDAGYNATRSSGVTTRYTVAPSKITLSNEDGKVDVSWKTVDGATAYRVYRRTVDSKGTKSKWEYISKKITSRSYTDTKVKSGTKYEYAVRVYSDGGNSDLYSEKAIIYLAIPEFSAEATVKGVKISWDKVAGAKEYKIYRKVKGGSWKTVTTVSSKKTSYTDTGATSGKTVYYRVKAVNGSYVSDYEGHNLYYLATPEVSIKNISTGVRVSWDKVSGATSYYVYCKAGSAKKWKKIATTKKDAYTDKSVKSGTTYKYCVRAVNSTDKSEYGSTSYEKIRFLSAPKLDKIKSTKKGVVIYWDDVKGADGYIIYRKSGSGSYKKYATVDGKSTVKYTDKKAKKGTTYSYRVYAKYKSYKSSYVSYLSIKDKY